MRVPPYVSSNYSFTNVWEAEEYKYKIIWDKREFLDLHPFVSQRPIPSSLLI